MKPVQPPTSRVLMTELASFLRDTVRNYPFPDPSGSWLDCRIFVHGLPEQLEDGVYPFVLVRWMGGEVSSEPDGRTLVKDNVGLFLGVYAPRSQAEAGLLCAELMDCLRRALWKERVLARRFELLEHLTASIPDMRQRLHQYHMATIETVWNYVWPAKGQAELTQMER